MLWTGCIWGLTIICTYWFQRAWLNRDSGDGPRSALVDLAVVLLSLPAVLGTGRILTPLGDLIYRMWNFYRQGLSGIEGLLPGQTPGDTVVRLLAAKPNFNKESRTMSTRPRGLAAHCPMCQTELLNNPTLGLSCPHCASGITYIQWTKDFAPPPPHPTTAPRMSFIWLPRRVGEYLKRRYENIWR